MRNIRLLLSMYCATVAHAQQPQPTAAVPKLVRFSGSFRPADGIAQTMESVTLSIYRTQTGGDALWHEIQNVVVDPDGHYSILMGATQYEGMPLDLFAAGEPRWLGAQFNRAGEAEQPRTLLVSVPYALKSVDADTLGGKPASAYLLAAPAVGADTASTSGVAAVTPSTIKAVKPKAAPANNGQPNYIGKFTNPTDLVDSGMYEVNGNVGIATTNPLISLDARTGPFPQMGMAQTTDYLTFFASDQFGPAIYWDPAKDMRFGKGGSGLYNPFGFVEQMRIKSSNGNVGIGTQTPGSKLDVAGDINFTGGVWYQGSPALQINSSPTFNVALGLGALLSDSSGVFNSALGSSALASNTTGNQNTAVGYSALQSNASGTANTATGNGALTFNTASFNTAYGDHALYNNTTGLNNTSTGQGALFSNITGKENTANGYLALANNTGDGNTAIGAYAMQAAAGQFNTAFGYGALQNCNVDQCRSNIALGTGAGSNLTSGANNIIIWSVGVSSESYTIRIGDPLFQTSAFIAGIRGSTTGTNDAIPVMIDSAGQLGTVSSSRRFKEDIEDMGAASHDLMRLRPVTYRYKQPFADGSKPIQYGLIAEEVAEIYPDLVAHSADGQIETVKYQVLDSMLLNEAQRQQSEIVAQKDHIRRLEERLAKLEAALERFSSVQ